MMKFLTGLYLLAGITNTVVSQVQDPSDLRILKTISKHRPLKGAKVPANLKEMLGATHVGGKYYLSEQPYLIEGAKKLDSLGMGVCKLWFYKNVSGYTYHSQWNLAEQITLKELAQHPYYKEAFAVLFSTIVLSTGTAGINMLKADSASLAREYQEYYDLTVYLLETYRERRVDFIFSNWEGDWIVRGGVGRDAQWGRTLVPADADARFESMRRVFQNRQNAVSAARNKVSGSLCRVLHSIEVNKVIDGMHGVPSLTTHVLPYVETDMVSWSAYDATDFDKTGLDLYKGIDFIKAKMKPTSYIKEKVVYLGEIGIPEMATKNLPSEFRDRWDTYFAVCIAQKVPYIIQWELYCNEPSGGKKIDQPAFTRDPKELNGFWLLRPDGTSGYAMQYFSYLLKNAGKRISGEGIKIE
jgi:hypothetical protein